MTLSFDKFTVRPITGADRLYIAATIEADPMHRDNMKPADFLNLEDGEDAWAIEDEFGHVLYYFKLATAVRVSSLFTRPGEKRENRRLLLAGTAWLEGALRNNGFREILFDTLGPELAAMAQRRMGFEELPPTLHRSIPTLESHGLQEKSSIAVPQVSEEGG